MKQAFLAGVMTLLLPGAVSAAEPMALDACVKASLAMHPGKIKSLSAEIEDGKRQYELDIKDLDGNHWEVECDATTGKINRVEREIHEHEDAFQGKARISREAATQAALAKYPGKVINTEYDIEDDGEISYEFIIERSDGRFTEIEVDAVTGKLAGEEEVLYHIGGK